MTARTIPTSWRMVAASAALTISGVPFLGPIAAARVGYTNGEFILNPTIEQTRKGSDLDLVVAGTRDAVMMVESEAKELSEETMLGGGGVRPPPVPAGDRPDHRAGRRSAPRSPGSCRRPTTASSRRR